MNERKWTPGPWSIVWYDAGDKDEWLYCPLINGSEESDRAVVHWDGFKQKYWQSADGKQSEIEANAHLISAAPDLYEALEAMLKSVDGVSRGMAFDALAKARGEKK